MNVIKLMSVTAVAVVLSACGVCQTREAPMNQDVADCINQQKQDLESGLSAEISAKQLQVSQIKGGALKIAVSSDSSFEVGSATIGPKAQELLTKVAKVVAKCDRTVVRVVGHTDSTGTPERNQALSDRRAAAVAALLSKHGVKGKNIKKEGRGEREPVASNDTVEGKRENRRVDIIISP